MNTQDTTKKLSLEITDELVNLRRTIDRETLNMCRRQANIITSFLDGLPQEIEKEHVIAMRGGADSRHKFTPLKTVYKDVLQHALKRKVDLVALVTHLETPDLSSDSQTEITNKIASNLKQDVEKIEYLEWLIECEYGDVTTVDGTFAFCVRGL